MRLPDIAAEPAVQESVARALAEDRGAGDVTTLPLVPEKRMAAGTLLAREPCIVAGMPVAELAFHGVDPKLAVEHLLEDGARAEPDQPVLRVNGRAASILTAERTALNFMQRMCGIATLAAQFVERARPFGVEILDTRKTAPTLRRFEKYAVLCGGGRNHRMGLYDMALVKDNHRKLWAGDGAGSLSEAVRRIRQRYPGIPVEVEVESEAELDDVLAGGPDWVLLDNMAPEQLKHCVARCAGRCRLEASGGITLENVAEVAASGVDAISLGCLTHSARAIDLSLELEL